MEMGSNLMQVDEQILALAQREKRACSSIVNSLETLAWSQLHSNAKEFSMVGTINCFFIYLSCDFQQSMLAVKPVKSFYSSFMQ